MTNELNISGVGNVGLQNVSHSEVDVTIIIGKSQEYEALVKQLEKEKKYLARLTEDEAEERAQSNVEIARLENEIEQFKKSVIRLAEAFNRIDINTERLKNAKKYFEEGKISEARAVFDSEMDLMKDEQARLLERKRDYEENIEPMLRNNAEEFMMRALLAATDYANPTRYAEMYGFFEDSIKSFETKNNLFQYATSLLITNHVAKADHYYTRYMEKFGDELENEEKINIHVNLGYLYFQQNNFVNAEASLTQALELLKDKEAAKLENYKAYLGSANLNLGLVHQFQGKLDEAEKEYGEALEALRELAKTNLLMYAESLANVQSNLGAVLTFKKDYENSRKHFKGALETYNELFEKHQISLPYSLINMLLNLGNLNFEENHLDDAGACYIKALEVIAQVIDNNPPMYLPRKTRLLNALATVLLEKNNLEEALKYYREAFSIVVELEKADPETHLADYASILTNLADIYCKNKINRDISIAFAVEVLAKLSPVIESLPYLGAFFIRSVNVLKEWGFNEEEIDALVTKKMNQPPD